MLGILAAAVVPALAAVRPTVRAEEADVVAGGAAQHLDVQHGLALAADGLGGVDALSRQSHEAPPLMMTVVVVDERDQTDWRAIGGTACRIHGRRARLPAGDRGGTGIAG